MRWSRNGGEIRKKSVAERPDLVETAVEDLLDLRTLECHSLEVSLVVVVEERESLSSICSKKPALVLTSPHEKSCSKDLLVHNST